MRQMTASMLKSPGRWEPCVPRPGTNVRRVYDVLYAYRGQVIPRSEHEELIRELGFHAFSAVVKNLTNFWGCDVRKVGGSRFCYALVGEWVGSTYLDYTAPAVERAEETT